MRLAFPSMIKNFVVIYRFAIIAVFLSGAVLTVSSLNEKQRRVDEILLNVSDRTRKTVSYDIDYVKYQLFYASSQISTMSGNQHKIRKLLTTFLTNVNRQVDVALTWNAFSWIDNKGKITIDGTSGILTKPIDVSKRDYLRLTPNSYNKIIFGKPIYGALSQRYIIPAGIGTFSDKGRYIGTLVFGFDIEKIVHKVEKVIDNKNISFAFFQEGDFVFGSENFDRNFLRDVKDLIKEAALDDSITRKRISKQSIFRERGINSYLQKIKGYPLEFVMFYDSEAYYRESVDILFRQIVFIFVILVACILLFRNIYRKIVSPISQLADFAQKISQHDFSFEMKSPESKELTELYRALKLLRESFKREEDLVKKLKSANQKIAQENFNKSEFLSAISHDIRNPLSAIISYVELLKNNDDSKRKEHLEEIESCANEALQFINDLMDVTQISSGVFSINMSKKIDICEMIWRCVRVNRDFANRKQIEIINGADENLPTIYLDQRRIKQILVNLISNAIKYSRNNTKVKISAQKIGEKLKITVADEGIGMNKEQLEKATEKFGLADENEDRMDSFGIGLSLVKQLVELQNGTIEIDSEIGKGTKVILLFEYGKLA